MTNAAFADLTGLRTVVTGSSSGIGRAIAWEFARGGADVVVHCCRSVQKADSLAEQIRRLGRNAEVVTADLGREDELAGFVDRAWDRFGGVDVWASQAERDPLRSV